jgi:FHA domain
MSDDSPPNNQETSIMRGSAVESMNTMFERFLANQSPFGFQAQQQQVEFHALPYRPEADDKMLLQEPWKIVLELSPGDRRMVLGLDLYGDVVLGRGESRPGRIILDFDPYGAVQQGVSREHLMLRPTKTHLFAIDQGSTNGTTINGSPSGRGAATPLKDLDMIAVGNLLIQLRVKGKPASAK